MSCKAQPKPVTRDQLMRAVRRYGKTCVAVSWSGGGDPADADATEHELNKAVERIAQLCDRLFPSRLPKGQL